MQNPKGTCLSRNPLCMCPHSLLLPRGLVLRTAVSIHLHPSPSCPLSLKASSAFVQTCSSASPCYPASLFPSQANDLVIWPNSSLLHWARLPPIRLLLLRTGLLSAGQGAALLPACLWATLVTSLNTVSVCFAFKPHFLRKGQMFVLG